MRRQLFVDLDGVLADFDGHLFKTFDIRADRSSPNPPDFWSKVENHGNFFGSMPVLPCAYDLWFALLKLHPNPFILTGAPPEVPSAAEQKRKWVRRHFGLVNVIACKSKDKCLYAKPGDILIDDWTKYQSKWTDAGGVFVHYPSPSTYEVDSVLRKVAALL